MSNCWASVLRSTAACSCFSTAQYCCMQLLGGGKAVVWRPQAKENGSRPACVQVVASWALCETAFSNSTLPYFGPVRCERKKALTPV